MDVVTGANIANIATDLVTNENVVNKTTGFLGMLFPYAGLEQKAVSVYIDAIEKSNMPPEAKAFAILNTKNTLKRIQNQKTIAEIAIKNSKEGTDFSEASKVNEDWLDRFMDSAKFVSFEELQLVWGKILANEFEQPGSTPPNMVRVLSEITPNLARAFRLVCSMKVIVMQLDENGDIEQRGTGILVPFKGNSEEFRDIGLDFKTLNELDTLGVIKFDSKSGYASKGIFNKNLLMYVGDKLELIEEHNEGEVPIGNVFLTAVGEKLRAITDSIEIEGYYNMVMRYFAEEGVKIAKEHNYLFREDNGSLVIDKCDNNI